MGAGVRVVAMEVRIGRAGENLATLRKGSATNAPGEIELRPVAWLKNTQRLDSVGYTIEREMLVAIQDRRTWLPDIRVPTGCAD
jgi:hypothetical protein